MERDLSMTSEHTSHNSARNVWSEGVATAVAYVMRIELEHVSVFNEHTSGESECMARTSGASIIFPASSQARAPAKPDAKGRTDALG